MRRFAAARALVIVLAVVAVVAGCSPEPSPSGTTQPAINVGWTAVGPALGDCEVVAAVVRRSGELVAVCHDAGQRRTGILVTRDGLEWNVIKPAGLVTRRPDRVTVLHALAERPDGTLILVGAEAADDFSRGDAAVWTSADGSTWMRGPRSRSIQDGEMLDVVATHDGVITVGADGFPGANVQLPGLRGPLVWRDEPSVRWQRTPLPQGQEPLLADGISAVPGGLVVWGGAAEPRTGVAWTSADGDRWLAVADPFLPSGGPIGDVVASADGGIVAVGCAFPESGDPEPGAWHSSDAARTWARASIAGPTATGCLWDAAWVGDRFLATGTHGRLLASADGAAWADEPVDATMADATLRILVSLDGAIIAFGTVETAEASTPGIWARTVPR